MDWLAASQGFAALQEYPYGGDRGLAIGARPGGSQAASLAGAVFQFQGSN
jgi:hypothetical protein